MNFSRQPKKKELEAEVKLFFENHPFRKAEFMAAFNAFNEAQEHGLRESEPNVFEEKRKALEDEYITVMAERLREKKELFQNAAVKQNKDFYDIMKTVIEKELKESLSRLGIIKMYSYQKILDEQKAFDKKLKERQNEDDDDDD